jgi:hypothetical protein
MKPDFNKAKIYKIVSYQTDKIYIGSTTSRLSKRLSEHISCYKSYLKGKYSYVTSYEVVKFEDCDIILLESVECNSKDELHARERYWIECSDCVNKHIPTRTKKQYNIDNKDKVADNKKQYYVDNKDKLLDHMKQKFECACSGKYTCRQTQRHTRTSKHQKYLRNQQFEAYIKTDPSLDDAVKHAYFFI